jgi:N-acylneuraminate cytidylyltransferase
LARIRLLVLDVDGTLTPGTMYYGEKGEALKCFHTRDGHGLGNVRQAGVQVAVITRETSAATAARMQKLGISNYFAGVQDKLPVLQDLARKLGVSLAEIAYVGDDEGDLPCLCAVRDAGGLSCVPGDAHAIVLPVATFITKLGGGKGAVREVCDLLGRARNRGKIVSS